MNTSPANQPNRHHKSDTFDSAETQTFNIDALGPNHSEIKERERLRQAKLQKGSKSEQKDGRRQTE